MSVGEIAGLIAAGALVLLVVLVAVPLLKLGRTLDETTLTIRQVREQSAPILSQASTTARAAISPAHSPADTRALLWSDFSSRMAPAGRPRPVGQH